jgi:hypothetical protein
MLMLCYQTHCSHPGVCANLFAGGKQAGRDGKVCYYYHRHLT